MTKAQKKAKAAKGSKQRRIAAALKKFVRSNPAMPAAFRKAKALGMRRNKGGKSVTIRIVRLKEPKQ
jgi:hypothetical protein